MRKMIKLCILIIIAIISIKFFYERSSLYFFQQPHSPFRDHLNKESVVIKKGDSFVLKFYGINKRIVFRSTDFKVAYVNQSGKVYARKAGLAYINVEVGEKVLRCRVRVLSVNRESLVLSPGESYTVKVYGKSIFSRVGYSSSKNSVASVSRRGRICAKKKGLTHITIRVQGVKFVCKLKVS